MLCKEMQARKRTSHNFYVTNRMSLIVNESNAHCLYSCSLKWVGVHGNVTYNSRNWWRAVLPIQEPPCCLRFGQTLCQLSHKNARTCFWQHLEHTAITFLQSVLCLILKYVQGRPKVGIQYVVHSIVQLLYTYFWPTLYENANKHTLLFSLFSFFLLWRCDPTRVMTSSFLRFLDHTQRRTTVGRTPLDEWSARRRGLYLTTHNIHNRQTLIPPVGFEPTISAGERPQT